MIHRILQGDVMRALTTLPDGSVQCVITSPPYWGLRDYSLCDCFTGGGEEIIEEVPAEWFLREARAEPRYTERKPDPNCPACGGTGKLTVMEGQIGLEPTPEEYVKKMVEIFREVRRVLREDGTVWLNIGDCYAGSGKGPTGETGIGDQGKRQGFTNRLTVAPGLKPKDLVGMPWRLAFALQADGWALRSDIIWAKPNPMPESVTDRPTRAHEYLFLLSKAEWIGEDPGQFERISDEDARWLALFIETEGCIGIKRGQKETEGLKYGCQIAIANTSRPLLEEVQRITGTGNILERKGKNHPVNYWQVSNKVGRDLLYRIYPFLISKKRQARIAIYLESLLYYRGGRTPGRKQRTDKENDLLERLWSDNKLCNHFGTPDLSYIPEPKLGRWNSSTYFYDGEAIREKGAVPAGTLAAKGSRERAAIPGVNARPPEYKEYSGFRNRRTVWVIPTEAYPLAHFATFPTALVEPCIKAGTSHRGACPSCGAPWARVVEVRDPEGRLGKGWHDHKDDLIQGQRGCHEGEGRPEKITVGWAPSCGCKQDALGKATYTGFNKRWKARGKKAVSQELAPSCACDAGEPVPCVVLDPFGGSGTVAQVARDLGRSSISIELNPTYVEMIRGRLRIGEELGDAIRYEVVVIG